MNSKIYTQHQLLTQKLYDNEDMLPSRYVLVLTNLCNLKCSFCFQERKSSKDYMNINDWKNLISQLPHYAMVTLTGGEPLILKDFKSIFEEIVLKHNCNLITNGVLLNNDIVDFLLSFDNFKTLSVSIDTIKGINRNISSDEWDNLTKTLKYFITQRNKLQKETKLDIKTTVLDENSSNLFEIHKYCLEYLQADFHSFQLLKGSPLQHSDKEYPFDDIFKQYNAYSYKDFKTIQEQLKMVKEYNQSNNKSGFLHPKITSLTQDIPNDYSYINESIFNISNFQKCKFPWSSIHINYDGKVFPCLSINMGNVKDEKLSDIIFGDKFVKFKKIIKDNGLVNACNRCGWLKPNYEVDL